ncbi:MAG: radical SAM protein [Proteobacteria bacterium]|nr:radical SAM protein [Pseudomonadota bacterium]
MDSCRLNNLAIQINKQGATSFVKASHPIRFGKYAEIKTPEYEFQFNLNGEIKSIRGLTINWTHPSEFLKRTDGNDWVFYSVGTIGRKILSWLGEYYLPCLPYPSNSIWEFNPFTDADIMKSFAAWSQLYADLHQMQPDGVPPKIKDFLDLVAGNDETALHNKSKRLHSIIGGRVSVLPPDARHVDYDVIPLTIADGCRYHCGFCCVKSDHRFQPRTRDNIIGQIQQLKALYGLNLANYKALFLANHDGLGAGDELICLAAAEALAVFEMKDPVLLLFGSVDSLLQAGDKVFDELNQLASHTYVNIGLESVDPATLAGIKKPLDVPRVLSAFQKILEINRDYPNIEITANFLLGEDLSADHNQSVAELLGGVPDEFRGRGSIYFSPLITSHKRPDLLPTFFEIQQQSKLPTHIYLIQRL